MNKKLLFLLVGMIVCLSVIGGALAVNYISPDDKTGNVTGDSVIQLALGETTSLPTIEMAPGVLNSYEFTAQATKSASATVNATLTITITATESKNLNDVTFVLLEDGTAVGNYGTEGATSLTGAGSITVTVSDANLHSYKLTVLLADETYDEAALNEIGGSINVSFTQASEIA